MIIHKERSFYNDGAEQMNLLTAKTLAWNTVWLVGTLLTPKFYRSVTPQNITGSSHVIHVIRYTCCCYVRNVTQQVRIEGM